MSEIDPKAQKVLEFAHDYQGLLRDIMDQDTYTDGRSERQSKAFPTAKMIHMDCSEGTLAFNGMRSMSARSAAAELAWTLSGEQHTEWLTQHTDIWDKFVDYQKDGRGIVKAAYGHRTREHFGRDQLVAAIDALVEDPTSKQQMVMYWDPSQDGLGNFHAKNVPCPLGFQITINDDKVNLYIPQRASDAVLGLSYDSAMYGLLLHAVTNTLQDRGLDVQPGTLSMGLGHVHVYEPQFEIAQKMVETEAVPVYFDVPDWNIYEIMENRDEYVQSIRRAAATTPNRAPIRNWQEAVGGGEKFEESLGQGGHGTP